MENVDTNADVKSPNVKYGFAKMVLGTFAGIAAGKLMEITFDALVERRQNKTTEAK